MTGTKPVPSSVIRRVANQINIVNRMATQDLVCGVDRGQCTDVPQAVMQLGLDSLKFMVLSLFHPRLRRDIIDVSNDRIGCVTRSDRVMACNDWVTYVVGKLSEWIDLDCSNEKIRITSEKILKEEFSWAMHLGLQAILLPPPHAHAPNYARVVMQLANKSSVYQNIWIRIPITTVFNSNNCNSYDDDGWKVWDNFRHATGHNHRISALLEIKEDIFASDTARQLQLFQRWGAEPVKAILLHTTVFLTNKKGFPVLSEAMQDAMKTLFRYNVKIVFKSRPRHEGNYLPYIQYLNHLKTKFSFEASESDRFCAPYRDTLQSPLQPLMDNLESQVYETFERDPVKYNAYEAAITAALIELDGNMGKWKQTVVITVVGAGRGPLIACALRASLAANVKVRVYAVEKNHNAVITLKNRVLTEKWEESVQIYEGDMRTWNPVELADILVSELLGSWGDNELSPECLDGAQNCIKPNGISIPSSSTSYIGPVASSRLWMCANELPAGLDTPYVVLFHHNYKLSDSKPLFTFHHPNPAPLTQVNNSRYASIDFVAQESCTIHGFIGSFTSTLYGDIRISIVPNDETPGMFSWFPLFIPLSTPLRVNAGDRVVANVWRCVSDRKVWYEWNISSPIVTKIQNSNGSAYWIGL